MEEARKRPDAPTPEQAPAPADSEIAAELEQVFGWFDSTEQAEPASEQQTEAEQSDSEGPDSSDPDRFDEIFGSGHHGLAAIDATVAEQADEAVAQRLNEVFGFSDTAAPIVHPEVTPIGEAPAPTPDAPRQPELTPLPEPEGPRAEELALPPRTKAENSAKEETVARLDAVFGAFGEPDAPVPEAEPEDAFPHDTETESRLEPAKAAEAPTPEVAVDEITIDESPAYAALEDVFGSFEALDRPSRPEPESEPSGHQAELALRSHFHGRRTGERNQVRLKVRLGTTRGTLAAETVDISRSGALFALFDNGGQPAFGPDDVDKLHKFVERHLIRDLYVYFGGGIVTRELQVVRTTAGGLGGVDEPLLACRFNEPLGQEDCELLGIGAHLTLNDAPDRDTEG